MRAGPAVAVPATATPDPDGVAAGGEGRGVRPGPRRVGCGGDAVFDGRRTAGAELSAGAGRSLAVGTVGAPDVLNVEDAPLDAAQPVRTSVAATSSDFVTPL